MDSIFQDAITVGQEEHMLTLLLCTYQMQASPFLNGLLKNYQMGNMSFYLTMGNIYLLAITVLQAVHQPTLLLFICLILRMHGLIGMFNMLRYPKKELLRFKLILDF